MRRVRGTGGRFLSSKERQEQQQQQEQVQAGGSNEIMTEGAVIGILYIHLWIVIRAPTSYFY